MTDSGTITMWLGVMAVALALQTIVLTGAAVFAFVLYQRSVRSLEDLQRREIEPVLRSVRESLAKLQAVTDRVMAIDTDVRGTLAQAGSIAGHAASAVRLKTLPAVALARAASAALSVLAKRLVHPAPPRPSPAVQGQPVPVNVSIR